MKSLFFIVTLAISQILTTAVHAENKCSRESLKVESCQASKIYDSRTHQYQGCNIKSPGCREYMIANISPKDCECIAPALKTAAVSTGNYSEAGQATIANYSGGATNDQVANEVKTKSDPPIPQRNERIEPQPTQREEPRAAIREGGSYLDWFEK